MSWLIYHLKQVAAQQSTSLAASFDQAEYRFYADGTEAGSTALADQNTDPDLVNSSNHNIQLRVLLQETAGGAGGAADYYTLQYDLNSAGDWQNVAVATRVNDIIFSDTFTEASNTTLASHTPDTGTSWTQLISNGTDLVISGANDRLDAAATSGGLSDGAFYTADVTYPSADYSAEVTMVTGDTGDDTNTLGVRVLDANNAYYVIFNEAFATLFKKVGGTITELDDALTVPVNGEVVKLEALGTSIKVYADDVEILSATDSSLTAAGKAGVGMGDNFDTSRGEDMSDQSLDTFVVRDRGIYPIVEPYDSSNLTDGEATTNRITGGTGSFVAGKVSEDGVADDVEITANNHTQLVYSITVYASELAINDLVSFRVLRNGTALDTYTVTPSVEIVNAAVNTRRYTLTTLGVG